jgi:hypothetical protein
MVSLDYIASVNQLTKPIHLREKSGLDCAPSVIDGDAIGSKSDSRFFSARKLIQSRTDLGLEFVCTKMLAYAVRINR